MKLSFSIELTRQPNVKKLVNQLDRMADEFIKDMEASKVEAIARLNMDELARDGFSGGVETAPPNHFVGTKIPVLDEADLVKKRNRSEGAKKAAETRTARKAEAEALAAKEARKAKRVAKQAKLPL